MDRLSRLLHLRDDVRHRRVEDEGVLVLQNEAEVMVLNDLAYRIIELAVEQRTVASIIAALEEEYDVARDVLTGDVMAYIDELTNIGVARLTDATSEENGA